MMNNKDRINKGIIDRKDPINKNDYGSEDRSLGKVFKSIGKGTKGKGY